MNFKYDVYHLDGTDGMFLVEKDIILPEGFGIAEKCRVGIMIRSNGEVEAITMAVSDPRWAGGYEIDQPDILEIAYSYTNGKAGADQLLAELLQAYKEYGNPLDEIMGTDEAGKLWGLSADHVKKLCADGTVKAVKIGKTWIIDRNQPNPKKS